MPERTIDTIATPTGGDLQASSIPERGRDDAGQVKGSTTLRASYARAAARAD